MARNRNRQNRLYTTFRVHTYALWPQTDGRMQQEDNDVDSIDKPSASSSRARHSNTFPRWRERYLNCLSVVVARLSTAIRKLHPQALWIHKDRRAAVTTTTTTTTTTAAASVPTVVCVCVCVYMQFLLGWCDRVCSPPHRVRTTRWQAHVRVRGRSMLQCRGTPVPVPSSCWCWCW